MDPWLTLSIVGDVRALNRETCRLLDMDHGNEKKG